MANKSGWALRKQTKEYYIVVRGVNANDKVRVMFHSTGRITIDYNNQPTVRIGPDGVEIDVAQKDG